MSATGWPPISAQGRETALRATILLVSAGGLVNAAAFAAIVLWIETVSQNPNAVSRGSSIYLLLCSILAAIVLSITGVAKLDDNIGRVINPLLDGTPKLWPSVAALILIHCCIAFLFNRSVPGNTVDTFTFQRDACKTLLDGTNPYGTTQVNIHDPFHTVMFYGPGAVVDGRVRVGLQYPPMTLIWALPGYLLGDVRYSYIFAIVISSLFIVAICPNTRGLWIVSALLFNPLTLLVENRCWTEPLVLMTLSIAVYAALKKRWWLPIALGFFVATKQYNLVALPLVGTLIFPFAWKAFWKTIGWSLAVCAITVVPFAVWNIRGLWHDLVLFHLAQPFRHDGLSFAVPFPWMTKIGPMLVLAFIAWVIRTGRHNVIVFAASYGVALLLFFSTSQQGMTNYYFLIGESFLVAAAALLGIPLKVNPPENAESECPSTHVQQAHD